jgi:hypothetical protein
MPKPTDPNKQEPTSYPFAYHSQAKPRGATQHIRSRVERGRGGIKRNHLRTSPGRRPLLRRRKRKRRRERAPPRRPAMRLHGSPSPATETSRSFLSRSEPLLLLYQPVTKRETLRACALLNRRPEASGWV